MSYHGIAETSVTVFNREVLPTISDRQKEVLKALEQAHRDGNKNVTNTELGDRLGWSINRVTPRVLELRDRGKVTDDGKRACRITGRTAYAWKIMQPDRLF